MERGVSHLINESPKEEIVFDETAAQLGLSPEHIETFLRKVNVQIEGEGLDSFDGDMLVALIDAYVTDNLHPERVEVMTARLLSVLGEQGMETVPYEDIMYVRQHMSKVMARRFEIARDSRVDPNEFSVVAVHNLRQLVDPDENFFKGPLDGDEVHGLVDLYALTRVDYKTKRKAKPLDSKIFDRQLLKLASYVKGRRPTDIQKDFQGEGTNDMPNIMNTLKEKLAWFALHPDELQMVYEIGLEEAKNKNIPEETVSPEDIAPSQQKQPEAVVIPFDRNVIGRAINSFLEASILPKEYEESFRHHIGFGDELPLGTIQQRNDACEKVRELIENAKIRDRNKYGVKIDNLPSNRELRIVSRMLGNRKAAIDPISRSTLVSQYSQELRRRHQADINEDVVQQRINLHGDMIDHAIARTLQWAVMPQYQHSTGKHHQESA